MCTAVNTRDLPCTQIDVYYLGTVLGRRRPGTRHPATDPGPGNHIRENTAGLCRRESDDNFVVDAVFFSVKKHTRKTTF